MHHRRTAAAVLLGAVTLAASACGSSTSADGSASGGSTKAGASAAAKSGASAPTDKQYCDAVNSFPDTSKDKTVGDATKSLTAWADQLKALGTPSDMSDDVAAAARTLPDTLVKAINSALGGVDPSTPVSKLKGNKDLEKKYDDAIAPLEKTLGDGSAFDTWSTAHCD